MNNTLPARVLAVAALALSGCGQQRDVDPNLTATSEWPHYANDEGGSHFSPIAQLTPDNVHRLEPLWTYHTGDVDPDIFPENAFNSPSLQATPILVDNTLYLCSGRGRVIALDPVTGDERWHFEPNSDLENLYSIKCRGVSYHHNPKAAPNVHCGTRILAGTLDGRLLALDAKDGKACAGFGESGVVDLKAELGDVQPTEYVLTSPPTVVGDRVITGAHVADLYRAGVPSGVIRAFDVYSGERVWAWDPAPPGQALERGFLAGTPNAWAPFSTDSERRMVFIPTGNPAGDYYGGERGQKDHFGSSVIALNADTGELVWQFQTVHNDVWDYDVPAQPLLFDYPGENGPVAAVAQATKMGFIFVLDRETGTPLMPVEERATPQGGPAPAALSPTQPYPILPVALHPDTLTEDDMWGLLWFDRQACIDEFRSLNYAGRFTPIDTQPTLNYPGFMGGMNWGGLSWDPQRKLLIANSSRVPAVVQLVPRELTEQPGYSERVEAQLGTPYAVKRRPMLSPLGAPCNRPPWGVLTAVDLTTGQKAWEVPLGTLRDLAPFPFWFNWGVPNSGGSLVTASGLTFIGAATDSYIRAFATVTGKELWRERLPAGAHATPMSYTLSDGRQVVVIAAGGNGLLGSKMGDAVVAFALPR